MSRRAEALVWDRSRAGKSDLLMLVKIADLADDEGRNAWPEVPGLMRYCRASERGTQYTLQRLEAAGEIVIDYNDAGRVIKLRGGRRFRPKWFISVRCVCDWEAYQQEGSTESATLADYVAPRAKKPMKPGRPTRKPARVADSMDATGSAPETRNFCTENPQDLVEKPATSGSAYKEGSVNDPVVEERSGAAVPAARSHASDFALTQATADGQVADPVQTFLDAWNAETTPPLIRCQTITPKRRRLIRAALRQRPLDAWRALFARLNRSSFARGVNARGFLATLEWFIGSPDPAAKLAEGQYDDRAVPETPFTRQERADATRVRANACGCPHADRCPDVETCLATIIRTWRGRQTEVA